MDLTNIKEMQNHILDICEDISIELSENVYCFKAEILYHLFRQLNKNIFNNNFEVEFVFYSLEAKIIIDYSLLNLMYELYLELSTQENIYKVVEYMQWYIKKIHNKEYILYNDLSDDSSYEGIFIGSTEESDIDSNDTNSTDDSDINSDEDSFIDTDSDSDDELFQNFGLGHQFILNDDPDEVSEDSDSVTIEY